MEGGAAIHVSHACQVRAIPAQQLRHNVVVPLGQPGRSGVSAPQGDPCLCLSFATHPAGSAQEAGRSTGADLQGGEDEGSAPVEVLVREVCAVRRERAHRVQLPLQRRPLHRSAAAAVLLLGDGSSDGADCGAHSSALTDQWAWGFLEPGSQATK